MTASQMKIEQYANLLEDIAEEIAQLEKLVDVARPQSCKLRGCHRDLNITFTPSNGIAELNFITDGQIKQNTPAVRN